MTSCQDSTLPVKFYQKVYDIRNVDERFSNICNLLHEGPQYAYE